MSTKTHHPKYTVRPRQSGGFAIYDDKGHYKAPATTQDEAKAWIATQAQQRQVRQAEEVAA